MEQAIEFEWLPTRCSLCKSFGHFDASCKRDQGTVWRKKDKKSGLENGETEGSHVPSASSSETLSKAPQDLASGKVVQPEILKENSSSKAGQEIKWTTPKKVGGSKQIAPATQNLRTNKGLNKRNKQRSLIDFCKLNKIGLRAFLETKLRGNKIKDLMQNVFMGWDCFSSPTVEGRILLVWKVDIVSLSIIQEDDQFIHCCVKIKGVTQKFCLTLVYVLPWLVVGDFNAVFDYDDHIGSRPVTKLELEDGHHWRVCSMLDELRSSGSHYTWSNKQMEGTRIFSKLDRVFNNEAWVDAFPDSEACINWDVISDHCCCLIKTVHVQILGVRPFRYFNMWADHQDFRSTILCNWSEPIAGSDLQRIIKKLKRLIPILLQFNIMKVRDVAVQFFEAKTEYQQAQLSLQQDPSLSPLQLAEKEAYIEFGRQSRMYERFHRQRSKITWLRFGDENTSCFHASLKQRKIGNRITSFMNDAEQECFQQGAVLTLEQQLDLLMPFTKKDVKNSLFSIHSIKSPRSNGYGSGFYKSLWKNIGDEISEAILTFFYRGEIPHELNNTIISLIPKVDTPAKATDYRPFACCNTLYKCISKMLCSQLTKILPVIVHQNQGAFIKNHLLVHNILILQDLLQGYTRKNVSPHCLIKIDLSKAYDSLD
ncbi:uncharacterized protein LOC133815675 [Humulus lupulus]|uniref:uncharacterized protein LOC133815675 n=1 Tax=Humulus lupulus TaxID=3486 RepID=UPI002B407CBA|nr:uncharacterized protein LOC133815675 [Humulus lupulus]